MTWNMKRGLNFIQTSEETEKMAETFEAAFDFSGRVALVTGGASGIGKAAALAFASNGAKVAMLDMEESAGKEICDEIQAQGGQAFFLKTDVADMGKVKSDVSLIRKRWGRIDILLCSAGIVHTKPFLESTESEFDRVFSVNVKGIFVCNTAVLPIMIEQKYGKIINIGSVAGKTGGGFHGSTLYGSTKGAVIALTKGIAREAAMYGINVNCICPGAVDTPMLKDISCEKRKSAIEMSMIPRFAQAQDIADMAVFLASDWAKHITSGIVNVDGGLNKGN